MKFLLILSSVVATVARVLEVRQSPFAGQNLRILPLGASITNGIGSSTGNGYRENLRNLLAGTQVTYVGSQCSGSMSNGNNEGHSGSVIADASKYAAQDISARPNVILVLVGTNDAAQGRDGAADRYRALVQYLSTNFPGALIVASKLFPDGDVATTQRISTFNNQLNVAGIGNVVVADFSRALTTANLVDGRHPDDAGYAKVARVFYDTLITNAGRIPAISGAYTGPFCNGPPPVVAAVPAAPAAPVAPPAPAAAAAPSTTSVRIQVAAQDVPTSSSVVPQPIPVTSSAVPQPVPVSSSVVTSAVPSTSSISTIITSSRLSTTTSTTTSSVATTTSSRSSSSTTTSSTSSSTTSTTTSSTRSSTASSTTSSISSSRSSTTTTSPITTTTSARTTNIPLVVTQPSVTSSLVTSSATSRPSTTSSATPRPSTLTGAASAISNSLVSVLIVLIAAVCTG